MPTLIHSDQDLSPIAHDLSRAGVQVVLRDYPGLTRPEALALADAGLALAARVPLRPDAIPAQIDRALALADQLHQPAGSALYLAPLDHSAGAQALARTATRIAQARDRLANRFRLGVTGPETLLAHLLDHQLVDLPWLVAEPGSIDPHGFIPGQRWALRQMGGARWPGTEIRFAPLMANPAFGDIGQFRPAEPAFVPPPLPAAPALMQITARPGLNLRRGPGLDYPARGCLRFGRVVTITDQIGDWALMGSDHSTGVNGFVHRGFLRLLAGGPPPDPPARRPFDIARQELHRSLTRPGVHGTNPRLWLYHASTPKGAADPQAPWGAAFVNWCVTQAGLTGTNSKWALSWHDLGWGQTVTATAEPGDIAVFKCTDLTAAPPRISGHVGFVTQTIPDGLQLLGGHHGAHPSIASFPIPGGPLMGHQFDLLSIRRPH